MSIDHKIDQLKTLMDDIVNHLKSAVDTVEIEKKMCRSILEDSSDYICHFLPSGEIIFANNAYRDTFIIDGNFLDRSIYEFIPHQLHENVKKHLLSFNYKEQIKSFTYSVTTGIGIRMIEWINHAIFHDEEILLFQCVGKDITECEKNRIMMVNIIKKLLSPQEYKAIELIMLDLTYLEVARAMHVDPQRIYTILSRIKRKLNINDIKELIEILKNIDFSNQY